MKREELVEYSVVCIDDIPSDVRDEAINGCTSFFAFDAVDAEEVMGAYKQRIKDLEAENERLKAHVPVWHSVFDFDFPTHSGTFSVLHHSEDGRIIRSACFYSADDHEWEFDDVEKWCELPPPPTTEEAKEGT